MAEQNLILNMLTFNHPVEQKEFGLFYEAKEGSSPINKYELPLELKDSNPELFEGELEYLYSDFQATDGADITVTVNLTRSIKFAKHYYSSLIRQHFANIADVTNPNFIRDNEIWIKVESEQNPNWNTYSKFSIKVNIARITKNPEITLSYEGDSRVLKNNLLDIDVDTSLLKWVVHNKQRHKYEELPDEARADYENVFPILNNPLRAALGYDVAYKRIPNKYKHYFNHIQHFYDTYLNTDEFKAILPISADGFLPIKDFRVHRTSRDSNQLIFGKNKTGINPYMGVLQNGPCSPSLLAHVDLFFICHEDDKSAGNELMTCFNKGKGNFPSLKKLLRIPININKEDQITFTNRENPVPEIQEQISARAYDNDRRYIAIYISPIGKDEQDPKKREYYYHVKEELLKHRITSQVIARETIEAENFVYSLPNIAIAILAKLDGVPWRLERSLYSELIVGVGAFKSASTNNRYIGSAFCFSNDGRFQGFECYQANDTYKLAGSIREAVKKYANNHADIKRLVIHFYKTMSNKELAPIREELNDLGLEIPIIIITINKTESKDLVVLDTAFEGLIPISGTFVNVGRNQYLLCNNTRYGGNGTGKIESYPFPVKISIRASDESVLEDNKTLKNLVDQVYQFSRMYWKSVKQQNLPVTIKYPEMVAEIFPHFESNIIPPFGKDNLWFL